MVRKVLFLLFALLPFSGFAQLEHPATWKFSVEKGPGNESTLVFQVKLEPNWHMYSQFTPDGGPLPMEFKYEPSSCVELVGKVTESKPHEEFDSTFMVKVLIFEKSATFRQKVRIKGGNCTLKGTVFYQA
ncbi:MAG: protein-disulfide reductase DsbD domain-containing protein [Bacteroidota bacterium]